MRYIQTAKVTEEGIQFTRVATEYEINMLPALKDFITNFQHINISTVKGVDFVVYTKTIDFHLNVENLFKLYSKYNNSKKDTLGIWGSNSIRDFFTGVSDTDMWFCFDGDSEHWIVVKAEKADDFLLGLGRMFREEEPKQTFDWSNPLSWPFVQKIIKKFRQLS